MDDLMAAVKPFRDIFRAHFNDGKYKTFAPQDKEQYERLADAYDKAMEGDNGK